MALNKILIVDIKIFQNYHSINIVFAVVGLPDFFPFILLILVFLIYLL